MAGLKGNKDSSVSHLDLDQGLEDSFYFSLLPKTTFWIGWQCFGVDKSRLKLNSAPVEEHGGDWKNLLNRSD